MNQAKDYLSMLKSWKDEPIIKAITGEPGSGKTSLFAMYQQYLRCEGVRDEQVIAINFDGVKIPMDYHIMYQSIMERLNPHHMTYIFLDEVQRVDDFEKAIASLYAKNLVDIYIAGPASKLLSGENATLLSGRYVQILMEP